MEDDVLIRERQRMEEILLLLPRHIDKETLDGMFQEVQGLLPKLKDR
jgi:hypothetical protein